MTDEGGCGGAQDRAEFDCGPVVLQFGAEWCPHCRALDRRLPALLARYPGVVHHKIEDGPGLPLGRSFQVRLWPTLVFLRDGRVLAQTARPDDDQVLAGLAAIAAP